MRIETVGGATILCGDALAGLRLLDDQSVHCIVSSPPYWGLRDYGTAKWDGGDPGCDHKQYLGGNGPASKKQVTSAGTQKYNYRVACGKCGAIRIDNQIGLESSPAEYVARMVEVFREVRRVLRDDGTLWLNLGDSYNAYNGNAGPSSGFSAGSAADTQRPKLESGHGLRTNSLKPKDLVGIPWRVAFALQADGWYLRQDIIWHKPNPMPESVRDRCTKAHEYIFLLSKSERYYFDSESMHEDGPTYVRKASGYKGFDATHTGANQKGGLADRTTTTTGRNKRSVWTVTTKPFKGAHFATFPPDLIEPCVLAGCPTGGTVLDPFAGAGTTGLVAQRHGRQSILIELNPAYVDMMVTRLKAG